MSAGMRMLAEFFHSQENDVILLQEFTNADFFV
jgi:hypothetical protein